MLVNGTHYRTIWLNPDNNRVVRVIDQRFLPHEFVLEDLASFAELVTAIKDMHVRGAGLIGVTAGFGMYLATLEASKTSSFDKKLNRMADQLKASRPTAVNLAWAVDRQLSAIKKGEMISDKIENARKMARTIADEDAANCKSIGTHGFSIIKEICSGKKGKPVNILTHCNAGWLAFTDYGTATSPIYKAFDQGLKIHVWVDETRPRNQGASLTAWELLNHGVPHTIIADNTGGHLMQTGKVDMVITGADRVTVNGDVANKIGTYLKALAAKDNNVPFYVAIPSSTIDWKLERGSQIPIEERSPDEVKYITGVSVKKRKTAHMEKILLTPQGSPAANFGFDVTPSNLVSGLITEMGICKASRNGIYYLFPDQVKR